MKAQGSWSWEQAPLLAEYVYALQGARDARVGFGWLERLTESCESDEAFKALARIAGGLPPQWDRHVKRAALLADQLALTDRGRLAIRLGAADDLEVPSDPLDALDDLTARREAKASA